MLERRIQPRMLCADLVEVVWKDDAGRSCRTVANLEDISETGACLQLDGQIPLHTPVQITCPNGELLGAVRYCVYRQIGYFVGVQFNDGTKWSQRLFRPRHLFDPRRLSKTRGRVSELLPN